MAKSKSHSKQHSKSKVVQKGAQQGLAPKAKGTTISAPPTPTPATSKAEASTSKSPAFSAANASLQKVSTPEGARAAKTENKAASGQASVTRERENAVATPVAPSERALELAPEFAALTKNASAKPVAPREPQTKPASQPILPSQVVREVKGRSSAPIRARRSWSRRPSVWIGGGLGALLLVVGGAAAGAYSKFASGGTIAPGVSVAGVAVGGLTPEAAEKRVANHFGRPRIALLCAGEKVEMPLSTLGAKLSIEPTIKKAFQVGRDGFLPNNLLRVYGNNSNSKNFMLPIEWNKVQLVRGLHSVNEKVAVKPVDARLRAAVFGLEVVPDRQGRELNVGAAAHLLQRKFYIGVPSLHVPARAVEAKIKAASLDGHDVQLAHYTTRFNSGLAGRTENLRIACRAIQNQVLMPGETFSFNASTGERTADKGYRMAHIFQRQPGAAESEVVDGLAGGVCQVSSTLFNAVRKTNAKAEINPLKIVERTSHSLPVTYVPRGLDATVAWPYKDFKFRNVTDYPVYIQSQMGRSNLTISIWGRVPND